MSYPGSSYPLSYRRYIIPASTDHGYRYGNTTSTSNTSSTGLASTGASGYSGHSRWTGESGTTSNLTTKLGELDIHSSQENSKLPITDPSRLFSSSVYSSSNHEQDKLVNDMFSSKRSPAPSPSPSNLRQEEGNKPDPIDPRSSLRKLLDCVKELQDLDVEKCLRDYKIIKEASDPMGLTKEVRIMVILNNILYAVRLATFTVNGHHNLPMENWFALTYLVTLDNLKQKNQNQKTKVSLPENICVEVVSTTLANFFNFFEIS